MGQGRPAAGLWDSSSEGGNDDAWRSDVRSQKFSGRLRLFPLPDLVMFPHVMQPLHVFEPRYRDLVADAVADDHLLGMALWSRAGSRTTKAGRRSAAWSA